MLAVCKTTENRRRQNAFVSHRNVDELFIPLVRVAMKSKEMCSEAKSRWLFQPNFNVNDDE